MKIYNAFGIKPTNTYVSAGSDYYIPHITNDKQKQLAYKAFEKSYKVSHEDILMLEKTVNDYLPEDIGAADIVHLFLAYHNSKLEICKKISLEEAMKYFIDEFLIYDSSKNVWGICPQLNDTLFINSGIKIALDTVLSSQAGPGKWDTIDKLRNIGIGIAGLYVNKSGVGNKGYDVRACLVDEDYSGYVHLSMAFTKDTENTNKNIYCGDKLTQMMLIPIFHTQYEEIDENEYNKIMQESNRGDAGFGSSDIKH